MAESTGGARILVVDDNEINRDMLQLRLELRGYTVVVAAGGAEALDLLDPAEGIAGEDFDAVLLDIMMPEISGLDVLRRVRRRRTPAELPVLMQTARDESEDVVEALELGANDYITKPIDFPVLFARLETHLRLKRLVAEKDEFLAIASHDLKNPLAIVRGYANLVPAIVPEGRPMSSEALDLMERIVRQTVTMERIVNDFLDFQAIEEGRLTLERGPVDLEQIVRNVVESLSEYAARKEVQLRVTPPESPLPAIRGDGDRLHQVLENLISNAIKYGEPGTSVDIRLRHEGVESDGRSWVSVEVSDSGPGISESEMPRLFTKFGRLSNRPTGGEKSSGVGLAICKRLVEMHDGQIGARRNFPNPGSTFWLRLPVEGS